jgi:ubiquinone biosynthesis protein
MFWPYKKYRSLRRSRQIIVTLSRYGFDELADRLKMFRVRKWRKRTEMSVSASQTRAERVRLMLERLGPGFIKIGQVLSTRADLLPADIVIELSNLQDQVAHTPWDVMVKKSNGRLGPNFTKNFSEFDTEPIASASMAQVYKACLQTGENVAVKIIRPGTRQIFEDDLMVFELLGHVMQKQFRETRQWDMQLILNQIRASVSHELDMQHEGRNADIFRANFAGDPTVYVPKIYWEHTSQDVLVMEYIEGRRISDYFDESADLQTRETLANHGANVVLKQIFQHGFFQADPHPGNAFILDGGVICFLDFGMFGRLESSALEQLGRALTAVVKKDIDRLLKAGSNLGILPDSKDQTEFKLALLDLVEQYHGIPLKQVNVRKMLGDVLQLIHKFNVGIRHDFLFLIKALGTIEATGRKLYPDFDMLSLVKPFVRSMVTDRYTPKHLADQSLLLGEDLSQLARETPEHLLEILRDMRHGKFKIEFQHENLERPLNQLDRSADKLVLGMVIAALIVASAVLAQARIGPEIYGFPIIGGLGFLIAGITGMGVIFDILRRRK